MGSDLDEKSRKLIIPIISSANLKYMKLGYHYLISNAIYLICIPLMMTLFSRMWDLLILNVVKATFGSCLLVVLAAAYIRTRPRKIYLVDYACYEPDMARRTTKTTCMDRIIQCGTFTKENVDFQMKIFQRSGIGDATYLPESVLQIPPRSSIDDARNEGAMLMFGAIDELLSKSKVIIEEIDILVVNCSLFNPFPSLSAMVVNHYKLRENVRSYNLGGMGCSAGLISIHLAKQLLQVHPNSYALVVSMESITQNWYCGNERSMLIPNCLFRMGSAAILLSNKHADRKHSKYQLLSMVRTHKGADDKSYACVFQKEDTDNFRGVSLSRDLMAVAGEALKANITTLGPMVLPISEQLLFLATLVAKKLFRYNRIKPYIPDFKLAFEHFCIHAGGRAVLDELEKNLDLTEWHMEPSRMTLYKFGNTSSSSLWYELAYTEAKGRVKKGDRVWQIGFGSGFKCNSVVWRAIRAVDPAREKNPWMDEIDCFPVHVPKVSPIVLSQYGEMNH